MTTEAYGTTVFCDDIRHEAAGKITLVGCYSSEMNFGGPPPGLLPTFAALVNVRIPKSVAFSSLKLRVIKVDVVEEVELFEAEVEVSEVERAKAFPADDLESSDEKLLSMTFPLQWSPVHIERACYVKVRAYLDGEEEVRLGALQVNFPEE